MNPVFLLLSSTIVRQEYFEDCFDASSLALYRLNLLIPTYLSDRNVPEVASANQVLGVPNISARFGTAPFFWNWTLSAMIKLLPTVCQSTIHYARFPRIGRLFSTDMLTSILNLNLKEFLKDKNMVKLMVQLSYPMIQAVDLISGQAASIKAS